ncbi:2,3-diaminopropionate biosynthesis protein SbnB [Sphaerisporangium perillae]|uniref:2,3-diaminopropionate biosynthesis protein SbnB n=1 Tax=Sphaerisporangium perillae TaxID=2935860 RepID=UPI00200EE686|nr:2,3-diaminopropionate biosynthesis protein SbnB [Sphaerisporangium perillae]
MPDERLDVPPFGVLSGARVRRVLSGREKQVVELVEEAYRRHGEGGTVNPPSYFLRFPDRPTGRIIALPASVGGENAVDGVKWISSFPANVVKGIPRASGVLILNDPRTGYPYACLEASLISAARTAASAVLAADWLTRGQERPTRVGFFGTGLIARSIHAYFAATGWSFDRVGVHDLLPERAAGFAGDLRAAGEDVVVHDRPEDLLRSCDLVVFATVAGSPHVTDPSLLAHHPLVLHVSLRDLAPEIIKDAANVVDDVDHCLRAGTSLDLAQQLTGDRAFVDGTLHDVMTGAVTVRRDRPVIFSPFGLGVLDLAVGKFVHEAATRSGDLAVVPDFFP